MNAFSSFLLGLVKSGCILILQQAGWYREKSIFVPDIRIRISGIYFL